MSHAGPFSLWVGLWDHRDRSVLETQGGVGINPKLEQTEIWEIKIQRNLGACQMPSIKVLED